MKKPQPKSRRNLPMMSESESAVQNITLDRRKLWNIRKAIEGKINYTVPNTETPLVSNRGFIVMKVRRGGEKEFKGVGILDLE
jgi:hypothetical protein